MSMMTWPTTLLKDFLTLSNSLINCASAALLHVHSDFDYQSIIVNLILTAIVTSTFLIHTGLGRHKLILMKSF